MFILYDFINMNIVILILIAFQRKRGKLRFKRAWFLSFFNIILNWFFYLFVARIGPSWTMNWVFLFINNLITTIIVIIGSYDNFILWWVSHYSIIISSISSQIKMIHAWTSVLCYNYTIHTKSFIIKETKQYTLHFYCNIHP